jgi:hypothetical protein
MFKKQILLALLLVVSFLVSADGISVDAGLTPAQDRWIVRSQLRVLNMKNGTMESKVLNVPLVVAYGLTSNVAVMFRQNYISKSSGNGINRNGFNDPFLMVKVKLWRINAKNYTFGLAPSIGTNFPIGNSQISALKWNPELGLNASFRPPYWSFDMNLKRIFRSFSLNDFDIQNKVEQFNVAISRQFYLTEESIFALVPVLELGFNRDKVTSDINASYQSVLAPGFQIIFPSLVVEGLYQSYFMPSDEKEQTSTKRQLIIGLKWMF